MLQWPGMRLNGYVAVSWYEAEWLRGSSLV